MEAQHQHAQVKTTAGEVFRDMTAHDESSSREPNHDADSADPVTSTEAKNELVRVILSSHSVKAPSCNPYLCILHRLNFRTLRNLKCNSKSSPLQLIPPLLHTHPTGRWSPTSPTSWNGKKVSRCPSGINLSNAS